MPFRFSQSDLEAWERANLLAAVLDSALDAIIAIDIDGVVVEWSRAAGEIFQFSRKEAIGRPLDALIIPIDLVEMHRAGMARFRETGKGGVIGRRIEIEAVRRDGDRFPVELAIADVPSRTEVYFLARVRNITDRVRFERRMHLIARELNHRIKNVLAVVMSMARQTAKQQRLAAADSSKLIQEFINKFIAEYEGRLQSYARTHDLLSASQWNGADLRELFAGAFSPYQFHRVTLDGPDIFLPPHAVQSLGMCIHEMTTNAVKYGALSADAGRVEVSWHKTNTDVVMTWIETGGPPPGVPLHQGFGSRLIKTALMDDLQGRFRLDYPSAGLVMEVAFPLTRLIEAPSNQGA